MDLKLNVEVHAGDVKSRIHDACLVQEPVEVTIEGNATALSLMDAKLLLAGLSEAVARVEQAEATLRGDRGLANVYILGPTRSGMSLPRTKLGAGGIVFYDCMPDANLVPHVVDVEYSDGRKAEGVTLPAAGQ